MEEYFSPQKLIRALTPLGSQEVRRTIIGRNVVKPFMCYFEYGRFLNIVKLLGIP